MVESTTSELALWVFVIRRPAAHQYQDNDLQSWQWEFYWQCHHRELPILQTFNPLHRQEEWSLRIMKDRTARWSLQLPRLLLCFARSSLASPQKQLALARVHCLQPHAFVPVVCVVAR